MASITVKYSGVLSLDSFVDENNQIQIKYLVILAHFVKCKLHFVAQGKHLNWHPRVQRSCFIQAYALYVTNSYFPQFYAIFRLMFIC